MRKSRRDFLRSSGIQGFTFNLWGRVIARSTLPLVTVQALWTSRSEAASFDIPLKHLKAEYLPLLIAITKVSLGLENRDINASDSIILIRNCDHLIDQAPESIRKDLLLLFNILQFPITRWMMGIRSDWHQADPAAVNALIRNWNFGGVRILRYGYQSLLSLLQLSWYAGATPSASTGYPGVPEAIRPYVEPIGDYAP